MARPSKIDRLPPEIKESIGALRRQGRTIDEILQHLQQLGADVSRAALGRRIQHLDQVRAMIEQSSGLSEALVDRLGEGRESRAARLNIEMMQALVMRLLAAMAGDEAATLEPKEVMFLSAALKSLSGAARDDAELITKVRKQLAEKAADEAEKTAKAQGLSADTVAAIRQSVLGVAT